MILTIILCSLSNAENRDSLRIPELTDSTYSSIIGSPNALVIEFFSPSNEQGQPKFNEYESLYLHFNGPESPWLIDDLLIFRVNSQLSPKVTALYKVETFPTIIFIGPNSIEIQDIFQDNREVKEMIIWVDHMLDHAYPDNGSEDDEGADEEDNGISPEIDMIIEDVSSHVAERWREEFGIVTEAVEKFQRSQQDQLQETLVAVDQFKRDLRQQLSQTLRTAETLQKGIMDIEDRVSNRNSIESTQSRFNFTHMIIFIALGSAIGFGLGVMLQTKSSKGHYN